jgi:hypothetical protein
MCSSAASSPSGSAAAADSSPESGSKPAGHPALLGEQALPGQGLAGVQPQDDPPQDDPPQLVADRFVLGGAVVVVTAPGCRTAPLRPRYQRRSAPNG